MLVRTYCAAVNGLEVTTVTIEVSIEKGQGTYLTGLGDESVRESLSRIRTSFLYSHFPYPVQSLTINLAPADLRKEGTAFDLPIAIGIMAANNTLSDAHLHQYMIVGELGLDGKILPIHGALPIALRAKEAGFKGVIVPKDNEREAGVVNDIEVYGMESLTEVVQFLTDSDTPQPVQMDLDELFCTQYSFEHDFSDVRGQEEVKRAMEIAAAGGHNVIMVGPPGAGKSMIAKRLPTILPPLSISESLETTQIHSVAGRLGTDQALITQRPFRAPHHTISHVALVGGGVNPSPGEISLAHNGVLFADELPEFNKRTLEVLRQPLEDRKITISRAKYSIEYPCSFMFVAAMNPCPCGYHGDLTHKCTCTPGQIHRYMSKISGPLLDRIDLHVNISAVSFSDLTQKAPGEPSEIIRERVIKARDIQTMRFRESVLIHCNAQMTDKMLQQYCILDNETKTILEKAMISMNLSARAYSRILKVARTIADLDGKENIEMPHIAEAVGYRSLDRSDWYG